ncbi:TIGR01841 family phasin [Variovorax guangxiensis]|uniref:TIGR01841 family phasin n=1 Tax=Variovorax guangxiensis TaxID=1775474 RepID=UPI00285BBF04|nr:TIGR01841 family phasin [Variovorax guangxiensis]MDR6854410.1 phasin family protein [Variovorax guangxiensis]
MATSSKTSSTAGAKKARPTVADDVQEAFVKPLKGMAERLQNLPLAGAASTIVESGRKDLQALMEANERSYQGLQAVVARQTEMLKASIVDWQGTVKGMSPGEPRENLAKLDAMGKAAFKQALDDIRELSELAAKSQAEAFDIVSQRIRANVDEVSKLLKTPRK